MKARKATTKTHRRPTFARRPVAVLAQLIAACAVLVQCAVAPTTAAPPPAPVTTPSTDSPPPPAGAAINPVTAEELGASWRPECPVEPGRLRRFGIDYTGFDGQTHRGELIVHEDLVQEVIAVFGHLHQLRYPIAKMRTVDHYPGADDELSMEDNNTSAFNCRGIPGSSKWSLHAYGRAIDVNPLLNPFIDGMGAFQPKNAAEYLDRSRSDAGMLQGGDPAVLAFTDRGWQWGGYWRTPIDYQHFEWP